MQLQSHSFGGGVGETPTKFSKRRGLTGPQLLEGGCWERESDFFQMGEGLQFSHINKNLKYLMTKKVHKEKYFSLS